MSETANSKVAWIKTSSTSSNSSTNETYDLEETYSLLSTSSTTDSLSNIISKSYMLTSSEFKYPGNSSKHSSSMYYNSWIYSDMNSESWTADIKTGIFSSTYNHTYGSTIFTYVTLIVEFKNEPSKLPKHTINLNLLRHNSDDPLYSDPLDSKSIIPCKFSEAVKVHNSSISQDYVYQFSSIQFMPLRIISSTTCYLQATVSVLDSSEEFKTSNPNYYIYLTMMPLVSFIGNPTNFDATLPITECSLDWNDAQGLIGTFKTDETNEDIAESEKTSFRFNDLLSSSLKDFYKQYFSLHVRNGIAPFGSSGTGIDYIHNNDSATVELCTTDDISTFFLVYYGIHYKSSSSESNIELPGNFKIFIKREYDITQPLSIDSTTYCYKTNKYADTRINLEEGFGISGVFVIPGDGLSKSLQMELVYTGETIISTDLHLQAFTFTSINIPSVTKSSEITEMNWNTKTDETSSATSSRISFKTIDDYIYNIGDVIEPSNKNIVENVIKIENQELIKKEESENKYIYEITTQNIEKVTVVPFQMHSDTGNEVENINPSSSWGFDGYDNGNTCGYILFTPGTNSKKIETNEASSVDLAYLLGETSRE